VYSMNLRLTYMLSHIRIIILWYLVTRLKLRKQMKWHYTIIIVNAIHLYITPFMFLRLLKGYNQVVCILRRVISVQQIQFFTWCQRWEKNFVNYLNDKHWYLRIYVRRMSFVVIKCLNQVLFWMYLNLSQK
jgi:hypothetical protein